MRFAPALKFLRRSSDGTRRVRQDPADLGTAFGMEATLEDAAQRQQPSEALESQRAHPPLDNPMAWMRPKPRSN